MFSCSRLWLYQTKWQDYRITEELARQQSSKCKIDVVDGFKLELRNLTHIPSMYVIRLVMFIKEFVCNFSKVFKIF